MKYEKPEMEVMEMQMLDIITTSFGTGQGGPFGGEGDFGG